MQIHRTLLAQSLVVALSACVAGQDDTRLPREPAPQPAAQPDPAEVPGPMASFARLIPGEWQMTLASGTTSFTTWRWGPGQHSVRGGELELYYWHPGRQQVRMLSLHPDIPAVGRGVGEGTIEFEGDTAQGSFDLFQPRGRREMGLRWDFDGPDKYHDTLLEATGPEGLQPVNGWDFVRISTRPEAKPPAAASAPRVSEHLKAFEALLGGTWEAVCDPFPGNPLHTRSTFEWVPEYVYARVIVPGVNGEPAHWLDAYVYEHVGTGALRCLALSKPGGVYEGDVTVIEGGALEFDLKGYEGDATSTVGVRLDLEPDGRLRQRVWTLDGTERRMIIDEYAVRGKA